MTFSELGLESSKLIRLVVSFIRNCSKEFLPKVESSVLNKGVPLISCKAGKNNGRAVLLQTFLELWFMNET